MKNIPNYITFLRVLSSLPIVILLNYNCYKIAGSFYLIASLSDLLDGYLARKFKNISKLGIILDPLADKVMYISSLIVFIKKGYIPFWMVLIISIREIIITGIRSLSYINELDLPASKAGKIKSFIQQISFFVILIFKKSNISYMFLLSTIILTIYSSYNYIKKIFKLLQN